MVRDLHPICAKHAQGLLAVGAVVRRLTGGRGDEAFRLKLAFNVIGVSDLCALIKDLNRSGLDPDFSARQITDDFFRVLGQDVQPDIVASFIRVVLNRSGS